MRKVTLISLVLLLSNILLFGQESNWRREVLQYSDDITMRQMVVDSIVNESFWSVKANYMKWYGNAYRKADFSEYSKETLLNYFNRNLNDIEKDKIKNECKKRIERDIEQYKLEADKKEIPFDNYYLEILNKEIERDIQIVSERARADISPIYARLLGWLDYQPAIPILESVLKDSLVLESYAKDNRKELSLSCKLALARMGNKEYENEILDFYKKRNLNCNDSDYLIFFSDIFYINTRISIDYAIKLADDKKIYQKPYMYGLMNECSPRGIILIYIYKVINNYPIVFEYEETKDIDIEYPKGSSLEPFYEKQYDNLLNWLNQNKNTYKINTERLFMP